jgi:hypothetical protein
MSAWDVSHRWVTANMCCFGVHLLAAAMYKWTANAGHAPTHTRWLCGHVHRLRPVAICVPVRVAVGFLAQGFRERRDSPDGGIDFSQGQRH